MSGSSLRRNRCQGQLLLLHVPQGPIWWTHPQVRWSTTGINWTLFRLKKSRRLLQALSRMVLNWQPNMRKSLWLTQKLELATLHQNPTGLVTGNLRGEMWHELTIIISSSLCHFNIVPSLEESQTTPSTSDWTCNQEGLYDSLKNWSYPLSAWLIWRLGNLRVEMWLELTIAHYIIIDLWWTTLLLRMCIYVL